MKGSPAIALAALAGMVLVAIGWIIGTLAGFAFMAAGICVILIATRWAIDVIGSTASSRGRTIADLETHPDVIRGQYESSNFQVGGYSPGGGAGS